VPWVDIGPDAHLRPWVNRDYLRALSFIS